MKEFNALSIGDQGFLVIFDSKNNIVYHPDSSLLTQPISKVGYPEEIVEAISSNKELEAVRFTSLLDGSSVVGTTAHLSKTGYSIMGVIPESEYTALTDSVTRTIQIWFTTLILLLFGLVLFVGIRTTRDLKVLNTAVSQIADGELNVKLDIHSNDEIGEIAQNTNRIINRLKAYIAYIGEISRVLDQIGRKDFIFTLEQEYNGEFAKVKKALLNMQETITGTLHTVIAAADQVYSSAEQIAGGAQSQAQGATEQASSVEELAETLQDVAQKTDNNTSLINETGSDIGVVVEKVNEGEKKMEEMLTAMDSISDNAAQVEKIIKGIEDIAFQTNILALNAAVEAARAGEAGKGFAVVADEVRNLAGKTAEASKNTANLIRMALEAVENGKVIAGETSASFDQVAAKVEQVAEKAKIIVENSEKQAEQIGRTARGVDQISSVVQTNSATAEQSAAASQELSGQAQMLKNLVGEFKLPDEQHVIHNEKPLVHS